MWHGPIPASVNPPALPAPSPPGTASASRLVPWTGPKTIPSIPNSPSPAAPLPPSPFSLPPGRQTPWNGPHTALSSTPPAQLRPQTLSPPVKGTSKASMWHGPHTANPPPQATGRAAVTAAQSADCKAPYQIGLPLTSSGGTCTQFRDIFTDVSFVNCAGCPSPTAVATTSTSDTAYVGFGGLFGPGPVIV
jgi:hypothetical protein